MAEIPDTMTAVEITAPGGPDVLKPKTVPVPTPGPGQILIKVAAAGVNRPDVAQRMGVYPPPPGHSPLPGLEVAGEIVATGGSVSRWRPGNKVCALVNGGGYAEYCLAEEPIALPIPAGLDMIKAAAVPETFFTVWNNVFDRGRLGAGEWLLVHGGASGIGTTAIQLAKAFGCTVVTTVRNAEKAAAVTALGADHAILYKDNDWLAEAKAKVKGVDVVLDMVGGEYIGKDIELLKPDGRLVIIATQIGAMSTINGALLMMKRLTVTGSTLRPQSIEAKGRMAAGLRERAWPLLASGKIKPVIHKTFPLAQAAAAHAELERAEHVGKVMLVV